MLPKSLLHSKKNQFLLGFFIFVIVFCIFYYRFNDKANLLVPNKNEAANYENKISSETEFIQRIHYTRCGEEEVIRTKPADNIIGLSLNELGTTYKGWNIVTFSEKEVEMTIDIDNFCQEHANNEYIGIKDGVVTVFYGKPGSKPIVKESTEIHSNKLMSQDIEILQRGLLVHTKEELMQTLEGLQSR